MTDAISTSGLQKCYRRWRSAGAHLAAVSNLDLCVPVGGIAGLLGPNVAGKTTTIKMLLGIAQPTAGSISVLGRDARRDSLAIRRDAAFVPQERDILGWMRVGDFIARMAALVPSWDADRADRLLREWQLEPRSRLGDLSTGLRSRLFLLVALARRASLLVLDEPTTGLDPEAVDAALAEIAMSAADGTTVLLVTQRLDEVERICDRVIMMHAGRIVMQDDLDDVRASWRALDVVGHPHPERMLTWEEVFTSSIIGEGTRLLVRANADGVSDRIRMMGAEVTSIRALTLREIYLATTLDGREDADGHDLA